MLLIQLTFKKALLRIKISIPKSLKIMKLKNNVSLSTNHKIVKKLVFFHLKHKSRPKRNKKLRLSFKIINKFRNKIKNLVKIILD